MNKAKVTVLIPAFNEGANIGEMIRSIHKLHPDFEVLVVNDGSEDQTMDVALDAGANVWPHPYNMGNGAAVKTGLRCASGDWIVMMDADGQHDPADITRLLEHKDKYDMVVGARTKASIMSWHRNLANWLYNRLASYVCKFRIKDLTSGFRLLKTETARKYIYMLPNTFSYPSTLTLAYLRNGRTIKYVPIKTRARKGKGKSKIKLIEDGSRFFIIIVKIATLFSPLRVFLPVSFIFFTAGIAYYVFTFLTYHRFSNMSLFLLMNSVIIFMMGLVSEQISQMRNDRIEK